MRGAEDLAFDWVTTTTYYVPLVVLLTTDYVPLEPEAQLPSLVVQPQ